jgi:hypothetical protein
MNAEWWKGRNERTGAEGIFPRSYVRVEEKAMQQPSSYGNMPVDVAQGAQPEGDKKKGTAQKIGGKLGNAALFGAGGKVCPACCWSDANQPVISYDRKQYCKLDFLMHWL